MENDFNPYCEWLGLDRQITAPNYYQLLGLPDHESNQSTIAAAADRAMARVRGARPGGHAAAWAQLLDDLRTAKRCLTSPGERAAYDQQLQEEITRASAAQADVQQAEAAQPAPAASSDVSPPQTNANAYPPAANAPQPLATPPSARAQDNSPVSAAQQQPAESAPNDAPESAWFSHDYQDIDFAAGQTLKSNLNQSAPLNVPQSAPTSASPQKLLGALPSQQIDITHDSPSIEKRRDARGDSPIGRPTADAFTTDRDAPAAISGDAAAHPFGDPAEIVATPLIPADAPITVACCGRKFQAAPSMAGQKTTCPVCGRVVLVPNPDSLSGDILTRPMRAEPAAAQFAPNRSSAPQGASSVPTYAAPVSRPVLKTRVSSPHPQPLNTDEPVQAEIVETAPSPAGNASSAESSESGPRSDITIWAIVALSAFVAFLLATIVIAVVVRVLFG